MTKFQGDGGVSCADPQARIDSVVAAVGEADGLTGVAGRDSRFQSGQSKKSTKFCLNTLNLDLSTCRQVQTSVHVYCKQMGTGENAHQALLPLRLQVSSTVSLGLSNLLLSVDLSKEVKYEPETAV